jgi:N utilization substance protein B
MSQISRKKTRRFLLQKLYARIYADIDQGAFQTSFFDGILDFEIDTKYFDAMFELTISHQREILQIIHDFAPKFDLDTMLKTNILAIAIPVTEMLWLTEEIPAKVSINEGIELAKYFWDDTSKKIVNGILNSFYENIEKYKKLGETPDIKKDFFY